MKERMKKILAFTPLKIALAVILLAIALFFLDAPFLRFMELKALDLQLPEEKAQQAGNVTLGYFFHTEPTAVAHLGAGRIAAFADCLAMQPDDAPTLLYLNRCRALKASPPAREWDGVYTLTKK